MLEAVFDEQSFLKFLQALAADWEDGNHESALPHDGSATSWQNGTIGTYLESAASWGQESVDGLLPLAAYQHPENSWQRAAQILYMGKVYE
jgi:hypothetical protein